MNLFENLCMMKESNKVNNLVDIHNTFPNEFTSINHDTFDGNPIMYGNKDGKLTMDELSQFFTSNGFELKDYDSDEQFGETFEFVNGMIKFIVKVDKTIQTITKIENNNLKESKEVYIKDEDNFHIICDKASNKELFRAMKDGGTNGSTIEDLIKQFGLKLVK